MKLFYIRNLLSHEVATVDPTTIPIPNVKIDKEDFKRLQNTITFDHYFLSAFEGLMPSVRVTSSNQPVRLHAFIVDYDAFIDDGMIASHQKRLKGEHMPAWLCRTRGGGIRLIYEFEQPLLYHNDRVMKLFFRIAQDKLKLKKLYPGLDPAWTRASEYWDIGLKWQRLANYKIPASSLNYWIYEASNLVAWDSGDNFIPLEEIKKEIDKRYPNRWEGNFVEGARGIRFWDGNADNPTAVVVRKNGVQCFTGNVPFISWGKLLGSEFVDKYREMSIGQIVSNIYYDGDLYWRKTADGWTSYDKADMKLFIKVQHKIKTAINKDEEISDMDRIINYINEHNRVDYAVPLVMHKPGIVNLFSDKYLNIYNGRCVLPEEREKREWGAGFPFIMQFLENFFIKSEQLELFLSWLKVFYEGAYNMNPTPGQIMVLAGGVGIGKSFLASRIVGELVGGAIDGTSFLLGDTQFTATALSKPLILIDDAEPAENQQKFQKYSTMLKKLAANRVMIYNQKFSKACSIIWLGRVMVLCNTDTVSLGLIPSLELSSKDKMIFLRGVDTYNDFALPSEQELVKTVQDELPKFADFLLSFEIPRRLVDDSSRYKIKCIHDEELEIASLDNSASSSFQEMLIIWRRKLEWLAPTKREWSGNSTELWTSMNEVDELKPLLSKFSANAVGRWLSQLSARGFPCELNRFGRKREWRIWWYENGFPQEIKSVDYVHHLKDKKNKSKSNSNSPSEVEVDTNTDDDPNNNEEIITQ
jgi:hypothetical protein